MSLSSQPFQPHSFIPHSTDGEVCPMCDQPIPNERLEQVKARKEQHQREVESQFALRFKSEREQLVSQLRQQNEDALMRTRQEAAEQEAAARAEERQAAKVEAEAAIAAAVNDAQSSRSEADDLKRQLEVSATALEEQVSAARQQGRQDAEAAVQSQLSVAQKATDEANAQLRAISQREEAAKAQITQLALDVISAREEGRQTAEAASNARAEELTRQLAVAQAATDEKVSAAREAARLEATNTLEPLLAAARATAQQAEQEALLAAEREDSAREQVEQLTQEVVAVREEGRKTAAAELAAALSAKSAAEAEATTLREGHDRALQEAIVETREALEKSRRDAINAEQAKHFAEMQKTLNTVDELKRQLENKTALELGEGAEIDLHEALKSAFPDDEIIRFKRGVAGADIRHTVRHNGKDCGVILYDSKNHKAWRNEFVTKLRDDQIADKADHAILSTIAFPQGTKQLHVEDGVILVNPARAVVIARLVRRQVVQAHSLNLSNHDRGQKSLELYSFITSERFGALMTKLRATTDDLSELDSKEQTAHRTMWTKRAQLIGSVVKAKADMQSEIDRIIGVDDGARDDDMAGALTGLPLAGA